MKLITPVQLPEAGLELRPSSRCMAMGSCFAEHVGSLMAESGLQTDVNPFGVLYNPESIRTSLSILMYGQYDEKHIFKGRDGLWHSWMHSGAFSAASKEEVKNKIWERLQGSAANLKTTDLLLITFGTNRAYRLRDNELSDDEKKNVVANCHKEPASRFEEIELRHDEIAESWLKTLELLPSHTRVVFTVSPYRYAKYGFHESQLAKATLLLAIDDICRRYKNATYFPAYEIVLDELRDYRFYRPDMLHPSEQAVDFVFSAFSSAYFGDAMHRFLDRWHPIRKVLQHRPLHPESSEYLSLLQTTQQSLRQLRKDYPQMPDITEG